MMEAFPQIQSMISKLSTPELVQIAQAPNTGGGLEQYAAITELSNRKKMATPPEQPQTTVVEDMAAQAMSMPHSSGNPVDQISTGAQQIMAQQGQPQGMAEGGRVSGATGDLLNNLPAIMEALGPSYRSEALDADGARSMVDQFRGEDMLSPMLATLKDRDAEAADTQRRNLWLALARSGMTMAGTPGSWGRAIGAGGIAGIDAAGEAMGNYRDSINRSDAQRANIGVAQQGREDRYAAAGLDAMLDSQRQAREGERALASTATGIAQVGANLDESRASRADANWRDTNDLDVLAERLYAANEGTMVDDPRGEPMMDFETGTVINRRQYNRQDAMNDAIALNDPARRYAGSRGGRNGSGPDDLNEVLRSALFLADPMNNTDEESRAAARHVVEQIMNGQIGNAGASTRIPGGGVATNTRAPSEAPVQPDPSQVEAYRNRRNPNLVGERDGERVLSPYARQ